MTTRRAVLAGAVALLSAGRASASSSPELATAAAEAGAGATTAVEKVRAAYGRDGDPPRPGRAVD